MRYTTERHDRIVAVIVALSMVLSVGVAPVAAGVGGGEGQTARAGSMALTTSINSCTTISTPGQYVLANDITNTGASTCIRITASDVVLDGAGYTIDGIDGAGTRGVHVYEEPTEQEPGITLTNVTVTNLGVSDWGEGVRFDRVSNGVVDEVEAWSNEEGVRFDVLSRSHDVYGSSLVENTAGLVLSGSGGAEVQENYVENNDVGIDITSDENAVVDNELVYNYDGVEVYSAVGTRILGNHFETHRSTSVNLRWGATETTVRGNEIVGSQKALAGIWIGGSDNEIAENVVVDSGENGIAVARGEGNWIVGNQIEDTVSGLAVYTAHNNEFEGNTVRFTTYAIRIEDDAWANVFQNDDVANNTWAFSAVYNSTAQVENLFIGDSTTPTTLSFEGHDAAIRAVGSPPTTPSYLGSLGKFVGTNATSASGYLDLSVHYTDTEVQQAGLDESRLRLWSHRGSWKQVPSPNGVDTTNNVVSAKVTDFGVIAPLATTENLSRIEFTYGDYGGNLNIEVNGDFRNIDWFTDIHGATIGGASVTVTSSSVSGGQQGTVEIAGTIESFSVGGQEMWMDDVVFGSASRPRATVDFATLTPYQSQYAVGETFRSSPDNVSMTVEPFFFWDGTRYNGGEAIPSTNSPPMSGGSGQDMYPANVNLRFDIDGVVNATSGP